MIASVQVFGTFWCYSSSTTTPSISATLVSTTIGKVTCMFDTLASLHGRRWHCPNRKSIDRIAIARSAFWLVVQIKLYFEHAM
jgi:hypothetical protein